MGNKFKYIFEDIINKELLEHNLDIKPYIVGILDFYKSDYFKEQIKLSNNIFDILELFLSPFKYYGEYLNDKKYLFLYLNRYNHFFYNNLTKLIFVLYHELYHAIQNKELSNNKYNWNNYFDFMSSLELLSKNCIDSELNRYNNYHDTFIRENLANLYAIIKTKNYMKKYNLEIDLKFINRLDNSVYDNIINYSHSNLIDTIITNYSLIKYNKLFKSNNFDIFLTKDGQPKDINIVLKDKRLYKIDPLIIDAFLNSKSFCLKRSR